MKKNTPKISIITPALNSAAFIEKCILSVANQSYKNIEHLIIDGVSTDNTLDIVRRYAEKYPHIRWISEKDAGIYYAMNKGIDMADGEWVYFLGADDTLYENKTLEKIFSNMPNNNPDVIYGDVLLGDTEKTYDGEFTLFKLIGKTICHQAIFFKKDIFNKLGRFDVKYRALADWAFNLKWFSDVKIKRKYIPLIIARYYLGGFSSLHHDKIFFENMPIIMDKNFPTEHVDAYKKILKLKNDLNQITRQKDQEIQRKDQKINFMKSSKFWKLREKYLTLKGMFWGYNKK